MMIAETIVRYTKWNKDVPMDLMIILLNEVVSAIIKARLISSKYDDQMKAISDWKPNTNPLGGPINKGMKDHSNVERITNLNPSNRVKGTYKVNTAVLMERTITPHINDDNEGDHHCMKCNVPIQIVFSFLGKLMVGMGKRLVDHPTLRDSLGNAIKVEVKFPILKTGRVCEGCRTSLAEELPEPTEKKLLIPEMADHSTMGFGDSYGPEDKVDVRSYRSFMGLNRKGKIYNERP